MAGSSPQGGLRSHLPGAPGRGTLRCRLVGLGQRVAFWTAIVLPFTYLPLLVAGFESSSMFAAFLSLVALNLLALLVGHPHGQTSAASD
jgi:hypothetical protein